MQYLIGKASDLHVHPASDLHVHRAPAALCCTCSVLFCPVLPVASFASCQFCGSVLPVASFAVRFGSVHFASFASFCQFCQFCGFASSSSSSSSRTQFQFCWVPVPEPSGWIAGYAGVGMLSAVARRRSRYASGRCYASGKDPCA